MFLEIPQAERQLFSSSPQKTTVVQFLRLAAVRSPQPVIYPCDSNMNAPPVRNSGICASGGYSEYGCASNPFRGPEVNYQTRQLLPDAESRKSCLIRVVQLRYKSNHCGRHGLHTHWMKLVLHARRAAKGFKVEPCMRPHRASDTSKLSCASANG